mgnify:CR=1 FL=1
MFTRRSRPHNAGTTSATVSSISPNELTSPDSPIAVPEPFRRRAATCCTSDPGRSTSATRDNERRDGEKKTEEGGERVGGVKRGLG